MILLITSILMGVLWCLNSVFVIFQIIRWSVDLNDPDSMSDLNSVQIMINFMSNASPTTVDLVQKISTINPTILQGAILCLIASFIV
jgi:hypothetical protein